MSTTSPQCDPNVSVLLLPSEIKVEYDDEQQTTNAELMPISNQTHNPNKHTNTMSNHNLTNLDIKIEEEDNDEVNHNHQVNPSDLLELSYQPHSNIGYAPDNDPVILAQQQEITQEQIDMGLRNALMDIHAVMNGQIEDSDEYGVEQEEDTTDQINFQNTTDQEPLIHNMITPLNDNEQLNVQLPIQFDDHDHQQQPNSGFSSQEQKQVNTNESTQQDWDDQPEMKEESDNNGQMIKIEMEEEIGNENHDEEVGNDDAHDTEFDERDNGENAIEDRVESDRNMENLPIETISPHSIEQSQIVTRQLTRISAKRTLEMNNLDNPGDKDDDDENDPDDQCEQDDQDYEDEATFRSVKRSRLSSRSTISNSNSNSKQVIAHFIQCPQPSCKGMMIAKDEFQKHMEAEHSIGPFQCLVKDCSESFDNRRALGQHIKQSHQSITNQFHCSNCAHHFPSYRLLSNHVHQLHQLGHFECAFPACEFSGECRRKVINHYAKQHNKQETKQKTFKCSECRYETINGSDLKKHELVHSNIKPYRCKFGNCRYASSQRANTISHIRKMHSQLDNPKDFLVVELNESEDDDEVTSSQEKRSRPTSSSKSSDPENQVITVKLQCPDCDLMFTKDKFNDHLWNEHSIRPLRCPVKNCQGQSFDNKHILSQHIKQSHNSTTQWHCGNCSHHFPTYTLLSNHNGNYHQLGLFKCSIPPCSFTAKCRRKVINHFVRQHKISNKQELKCAHCQYETSKPSNLKEHLRVHSGIKPFRCKWADCDFAAAQQSVTVRHIQRHLAKLMKNSVPNGKFQGDPKQFLEVMHDLL